MLSNTTVGPFNGTPLVALSTAAPAPLLSSLSEGVEGESEGEKMGERTKKCEGRGEGKQRNE